MDDHICQDTNCVKTGVFCNEKKHCNATLVGTACLDSGLCGCLNAGNCVEGAECSEEICVIIDGFAGLMRNVKKKMRTLNVWTMGVLGKQGHALLERIAQGTLLDTTVLMAGVSVATPTQTARLETCVRRRSVS